MGKAHKKSIIVTAAVCVLVGACSTVAYFTDRDQETNELSVGAVNIDLEETFNQTAALDLVPTQTVVKEPYVSNTSTVPVYIFMEVTVPKANIITAQDNGNKNAQRIEQLFTFTTDVSNKQSISNHYTANTYNGKWTLLTGTGQSSFPNSVDDNKYVFVYNNGSPVQPTVTATESLFKTVRLSNAVEGQGLEGSSYNINIKSYAIQSEGCSSAADAYSKYFKQNP